MLPVTRWLLRGIHQCHSDTAALGALMAERPISPGQSLDRYVDMAFEELSSHQWNAAEALVNGYVVPRFHVLNASQYTLPERIVWKRPNNTVLHGSFTSISLLLKCHVQKQTLSNEKDSLDQRGALSLPLVTWDILRFSTGLDIGEFEGEAKAAWRLVSTLRRLADIHSPKHPEMR